MEAIALTIGILIGLFMGIVLCGRLGRGRFAGTLIIARGGEGSKPEMYLDQIEEPAVLAKQKSVVMDIKVVNTSTQK